MALLISSLPFFSASRPDPVQEKTVQVTKTFQKKSADIDAVIGEIDLPSLEERCAGFKRNLTQFTAEKGCLSSEKKAIVQKLIKDHLPLQLECGQVLLGLEELSSGLKNWRLRTDRYVTRQICIIVPPCEQRIHLEGRNLLVRTAYKVWYFLKDHFMSFCNALSGKTRVVKTWEDCRGELHQFVDEKVDLLRMQSTTVNQLLVDLQSTTTEDAVQNLRGRLHDADSSVEQPGLLSRFISAITGSRRGPEDGSDTE